MLSNSNKRESGNPLNPFWASVKVQRYDKGIFMGRQVRVRDPTFKIKRRQPELVIDDTIPGVVLRIVLDEPRHQRIAVL